jgi:hypothetical protein
VRLDAAARPLSTRIARPGPSRRLDAVAAELAFISATSVRAAREREHALAHEVPEHDPVRDRGIVERRAVRVADRLHEEAVDVVAAGEVALEELRDGLAGVVEEVHARISA